MRVWIFLWAVIQGYAAFNLTWGVPAVNLDSNPPVGDTDVNVVIAIDPLGNACATWGRTTDQKALQDIWAALYNHSSRTWAGAVKISGDANASNSQVAMDDAGNALFIWEEGFPSKIMSRTLNAAGVWSPALSLPPLPISTSFNAQCFPQMAMNGAGDCVVIWTEFSAGSYHICSAQKKSGRTWMGPNKISLPRNEAPFNAAKAVAINPSGNAIAVWEQSLNGSAEICAARSVKGSWLSPIAVSSSDQRARSPAVGIDPSGSAVIVWDQSNVIQSRSLINGQLSPVLTGML